MFTKGRDTTPVSCLHPSYRHCWLFGEKVIFTSAAAKRLLALSMQLKSDKLFLCPILTPSASWRRILANNTIRQRNKRRRIVDHGPDELAESRHLKICTPVDVVICDACHMNGIGGLLLFVRVRPKCKYRVE